MARYEDRSGNPCSSRQGHEQADSRDMDRERHTPYVSDAEWKAAFEARLAAERALYAASLLPAASKGLDSFSKGDDRGTR